MKLSLFLQLPSLLKKLCRTSIVLINISFSGCIDPSICKMTNANVPINSGKYELAFTGKYNQCLAADLSFSFANHFGVSAQINKLKQKNQYTPGFLFSDPLTSDIDIMYSEYGAYYFTRISKTDNNFFELSFLRNQGFQNIVTNRSGDFYSKYKGYAIQPAIYFIRSYFDFYAAVKFQKFNFGDFRTSLNNKELKNFDLNAGYLYGGISAGKKNIKLSSQLGFALYTNYDRNKYFWRNPINNDLQNVVASFGISYRLNLKKVSKK